MEHEDTKDPKHYLHPDYGSPVRGLHARPWPRDSANLVAWCSPFSARKMSPQSRRARIRPQLVPQIQEFRRVAERRLALIRSSLMARSRCRGVWAI